MGKRKDFVKAVAERADDMDHYLTTPLFKGPPKFKKGFLISPRSIEILQKKRNRERSAVITHTLKNGIEINYLVTILFPKKKK
jgi:hypothetical protein